MTLAVSRIADVDRFSEITLREADAEECWAAGTSPEEAVRSSIERSDEAFVHYLDGDPLCLWGWRVDSVVNSSASMWLLSLPAADNCKVAFARESQRLLGKLMTEFHSVTVEVHAKHGLALKWLRWLGFEAVGAVFYQNEKFILMQKERK